MELTISSTGARHQNVYERARMACVNHVF